MKTLFLLLLLSIASAAHSATYYIDYTAADDSASRSTKSTPWKRCPGMVGFAGAYSHTAGDVFVFKGGVTWPAAALPLTLAYSGTAANVDTYTVDATWYSGGAWSYPIFDGGKNGSHIIFMDYGGKSYIKINSLQLLNVNDGVSNASGTAIDLYDGSNIEISYCWLQPSSVEAFSIEAYRVNCSNINFHHNYIRQALRCTCYGAGGYVLNNVQFHDNDWQGPGTMYMGTYHADGLMIGNPFAGGSSVAVTNLQFYNNRFYGNWQTATALLYSNGWTSGTLVYNNVFSFENTTPVQNIFSPGFVDFGNNDASIQVYNNTFANNNMHGFGGGYGLGAASAIAVLSPVSGTTVVIKNNIFSLTQIDINVDAHATLTADYNLHYPDTSASYGELVYFGSNQYKTLAAAQAAGYETHSPAVGDPRFINVGNGTTGSANWQLQASSRAIGAAGQLTLFTADLFGTTRGAAWDIGAYQYTVSLPGAPVITSALTAPGTIGSSFSFAITATNSPTSFSASPLPAGLSVNTSTGVISGTPTVTGTTSVAIGATNANGAGAATLALTVSVIPPSSARTAITTQ